MDYPDLRTWCRVIMSPKIVTLIIGFLVWDHYILGGVVPYVASYVCGCIAMNGVLFREPEVEMVAVVITVFFFIFLSLRIGVESWFWRKLFIMEKNYYCVLACRDFLNCWTTITNISQFIKTVYWSQQYGLLLHGLGRGTIYVFLNGLAHWGFPIECDLEQFLPSEHDQNCTKSSCIGHMATINSAVFSVGLAMLTSSVARLVYLNSIYSYMSAIELVSEHDPFLQFQLNRDVYSGNQVLDAPPTISPGTPIPSPQRSEENNVLANNANLCHLSGADPANASPSSSANQNENQKPTPSWGWPLSFFREEMEITYSG